jgi:hypothetical protein
MKKTMVYELPAGFAGLKPVEYETEYTGGHSGYRYGCTEYAVFVVEGEGRVRFPVEERLYD